MKTAELESVMKQKWTALL